MPKIVPKTVQTCFEHVLGQFFRFFLFAQSSMEGRVFKNFQKNQKNLKIPKMPKIVPKTVQTCFEHVLGHFFRNFFCPVFDGGSSLQKFSKKSKNFQNSKNAQNRSQKCPNVFWTCFGAIFPKNYFLPSLPWRVESSKIFKKIKKFSKFQKCSKSFPKVSKRVLNMFWGNFFENFFRPVFHGGSSLQKFSKKSKNFQNSKNAQNRSQKCPNVFWTCFGAIFSLNFLPIVL